MNDSIFLKILPTAPPREPAGSDADYIKHVHCNGARFHVISYNSNGMKCSEPDCIMNKPSAEYENPMFSRATHRWMTLYDRLSIRK